VEGYWVANYGDLAVVKKDYTRACVNFDDRVCLGYSTPDRLEIVDSLADDWNEKAVSALRGANMFLPLLAPDWIEDLFAEIEAE
jgi:hypothetical protein